MDVEIFKTPENYKIQTKRGVKWGGLEEAMALHVDAQTKLLTAANKIKRNATAILDAHRDKGMSKIGMERGDVDYHVTLTDYDPGGLTKIPDAWELKDGDPPAGEFSEPVVPGAEGNFPSGALGIEMGWSWTRVNKKTGRAYSARGRPIAPLRRGAGIRA